MSLSMHLPSFSSAACNCFACLLPLKQLYASVSGSSPAVDIFFPFFLFDFFSFPSLKLYYKLAKGKYQVCIILFLFLIFLK